MKPGTNDATTTGGLLASELPELTSADLHEALRCLAEHTGAGLGEAELVDQIAAMEALKSGLAAAQARLTAKLARDRVATEAPLQLTIYKSPIEIRLDGNYVA